MCVAVELLRYRSVHRCEKDVLAPMHIERPGRRLYRELRLTGVSCVIVHQRRSGCRRLLLNLYIERVQVQTALESTYLAYVSPETINAIQQSCKDACIGFAVGSVRRSDVLSVLL